MYFGEFLIEKKIISEEQLLDALVFQLEHLPSFLRVLREEKVFSPEDLFRLIQTQLENDTDLITVIKNEKKLDEKRLDDLYQKQFLKRKMLGSVLVELKIVQQTDIEKSLHEFLRVKDTLPKKEKTIPVATPAPTKVVEVEISQAALDSLRELGMTEDLPASAPAVNKVVEVEISQAALDSLRELGITEDLPIAALTKVVTNNILIEEFLGKYSEKMFNKQKKILEILNQSLKDESDISNYFNSLYGDLLFLKGAAFMADLNTMASFINNCCEMLEGKLMQSSEQLKEWGVNSIHSMEKIILFLWEIRGSVAQNQSDECIKVNPELNKKYLEYTSKLKTLI
jgi:hypothetical protein